MCSHFKLLVLAPLLNYQVRGVVSAAIPRRSLILVVKQAEKALDGAWSVVVSPNGQNVYATSSGDAVVVFDRDTVTGELTQKAGAAGCISSNSATVTSAGCQIGRAMEAAWSVVVSADGVNVYIASIFSDAIVTFARAD